MSCYNTVVSVAMAKVISSLTGYINKKLCNFVVIMIYIWESHDVILPSGYPTVQVKSRRRAAYLRLRLDAGIWLWSGLLLLLTQDDINCFNVKFNEIVKTWINMTRYNRFSKIWSEPNWPQMIRIQFAQYLRQEIWTPWKRMETLSALQAFCEGNPAVVGDSPRKVPVKSALI